MVAFNLSFDNNSIIIFHHIQRQERNNNKRIGSGSKIVRTRMLAHKVSCLLPKGLTAAKTVTHARSLSAIAAATPSPLSPSSSQTQLQKQPQAHNSNSNYHCTRIRTYVSRAHPKPIPEFSVPTGLQMVLDGTEERKKLRAKKWERNKDKRRSKGIEVSELRFCGIYFGVRRGKRNRVD
jgi:hypothetical protein